MSWRPTYPSSERSAARFCSCAAVRKGGAQGRWPVSEGRSWCIAKSASNTRALIFPGTVWNPGWFGYLPTHLWTVKSVARRVGLCMLQNLGRKAPNAEWLPKILPWLKNEKNPNLIWKLSDNNCIPCSSWKLWRELDALFLKEIVTQIINYVWFFCVN